VLPPLSFLAPETPEIRIALDRDQLRRTAEKLTAKLRDLDVDGEVVEIRPGPVVTLYEFRPGPGVKVSRIAGLADDLAMAMQALRVRIIAPIPGKDVCGIEVPNKERQMVHFRDVAEQDLFQRAASKLTFALGKDIEGQPYIIDLAKMPHLLIAGTTGSGKSVSVNAMVLSMLMRASPEEVRLVMVDPKMLELSPYEGIPHLLLPVVTDPKKAALALRWAVEEMERRYQLLYEQGVRHINQYNKKAEPKLPFIVIMVDELADLMMVASREVEGCIQRLAQMARAAGIHLMLATQRPSTDVITGVIKANFPARISFQVASRHDSATVINQPGAENLLGAGDMLILPPGSATPQRVHGAFVSEAEIQRIVDHLKQQGAPVYDETILRARPGDGEEGAEGEDMSDELYDQALAVVADMRQVSISMLQRRMRIGYNRAARMIERMEREGVVGPADGAKPRDVLIRPIGEMPGA
jgi:S-DNA-T family DNA segregation ATPase FtsK/SpoIIIE